MTETPQQRAERLFAQYIVSGQHEPGYLDMVRSLRLRLDGELARLYARSGSPPHRLMELAILEGTNG